MRNADANSTARVHVQNAGIVLTVRVKNVMSDEDSFWVLYRHDTQPVLHPEAGKDGGVENLSGLVFVI